MKTKRIPLIFLSFCATTFFIVSCTKSSVSTKTRLIGTWKDVQAYVDYNKNGLKDANELQNIPASEASIITFRSDGTGMDIEPSGLGSLDTFVFSYKVHLNQLTVFMDTDSATVIIDSISSARLIFKDTSSSYLSWEIFEKQ